MARCGSGESSHEASTCWHVTARFELPVLAIRRSFAWSFMKRPSSWGSGSVGIQLRLGESHLPGLPVLALLVAACATGPPTPSLATLQPSASPASRPVLSIQTVAPTPTLSPITAANISSLQVVDQFGRGTIRIVAWTSDGQMVAVASASGLHLYDRSGELIWEKGVEGGTRFVTVSPNDELLAAVQDSGATLLLRTEDGEALREIASPVTTLRVRFSADGAYLYSRLVPASYLTWNPRSEGPRYTFYEAGGPGLLVWNVATGEAAEVIPERGSWARWSAYDISPRFDLVLGGYPGRDPRVVLQEIPGGKVRRVLYTSPLPYPFPPDVGLFSPRGDVFAVISPTSATLWDASSGEQIKELMDTATANRVNLGGQWVWKHHWSPELAFNSSGEFLATVQGSSIYLWSVPGGKLTETIDGSAIGADRSVLNRAFVTPWGSGQTVGLGFVSDTGELFWVAYELGEPVISDTLPLVVEQATQTVLYEPAKEELSLRFHHDHVADVAFSPSGDAVATCNRNGELVVRELKSLSGRPEITQVWTTEPAAACELAWPTEGILLVALRNRIGAGRFDQATVFKLEPGRDPQALSLPIECRTQLDRWSTTYDPCLFSFAAHAAKGVILHDGLQRQSLYVWDVTAGDVNRMGSTVDFPFATLYELPSSDPLRMLPSGEVVAIYGDGQVLFRNAVTGEVLQKLPLRDALFTDWIFSPDGERFAMVFDGGNTSVWSWREPELLLDFRDGVPEWVSTAAFTPDGRMLATVGGNSAAWQRGEGRADLYLWDLETGAKSVMAGAFPPFWRGKLLFSPDGTKLLSLDYRSGVVSIWAVAEE